MEENRIIGLAKREEGSKRFWLSILSVGIIGLFFAGDLYFFIVSRDIWNVVGLWITAILLVMTIIGTIYVYACYLYSKRIGDTPLVAYDTLKEEFIAYSFTFHKEIRMKKDEIDKIKVADTGEAFLWRHSNGKQRITHIGYAFSGAEQLVNRKIKEIKEGNLEEK